MPRPGVFSGTPPRLRKRRDGDPRAPNSGPRSFRSFQRPTRPSQALHGTQPIGPCPAVANRSACPARRRCTRLSARSSTGCRHGPRADRGLPARPLSVPTVRWRWARRAARINALGPARVHADGALQLRLEGPLRPAQRSGAGQQPLGRRVRVRRPIHPRVGQDAAALHAGAVDHAGHGSRAHRSRSTRTPAQPDQERLSATGHRPQKPHRDCHGSGAPHYVPSSPLMRSTMPVMSRRDASNADPSSPSRPERRRSALLVTPVGVNSGPRAFQNPYSAIASPMYTAFATIAGRCIMIVICQIP